jgi:uncharacterized protein (DUF4415 family)
LFTLSVTTLSELSQPEKQPNMNNEPILKKSLTDWTRLDQMEDEDLDFSDCPEISPEQFTTATVRRGQQPLLTKETITINLDSDVIKWLKSQGNSYQNLINNLLRDYMETHQ